MRKAFIESKDGRYLAAEGPTGGWRVFLSAAWHRASYAAEPISAHSHKESAIAAAERYSANDAWRARSA